jgi:hypothetical protein
MVAFELTRPWKQFWQCGSVSDSLDTWYPLLDLESKPSLQRVAMEGWLSQEKIQ